MRQACGSNKEKLKIKFHANKWIARTSRDGELIGYRRDTLQHEKYSDLVIKLADDFEKRFQDFRRHIGTMKLISNPFSIDPTDAADKHQLENSLTFRMTVTWKQLSLSMICRTFYSHYPQTSISISHRMPRSSPLRSETPTVANNCFLEWKTRNRS